MPEVVGRTDPEGMLELGHLQGVLRFPVHVMTEDDRFYHKEPLAVRYRSTVAGV
jgi:hypothetical protein